MKNIIYVLILLLIMGSCSDESGPLSPDLKGVPARLSLRTLEMTAATRSSTPLSTEYENKVVHLWLLQFAYTSDGSGTLLRKESLAVTDPLDIEIMLTPNAPGQQSKLYFVANMEKATFPEVGGMTEAQFKAKVTDQISSEGGFLLQNTTVSGNYIPMSGEIKDPVSVGPEGLVTQLNVSLVRMLARVDVIYKVSDGSNFTLRSIRACNIPNKISYYRSTDALGIPVYESGEESPVISNASQDLQDFAYEGSVHSSSTPTTLTFYLPPNHRGLGDNLDGNMDERLKLGKDFASYISFTGFSSKSGNELIYKFYPGNDFYNDYNIDRNAYYSLTASIDGVSLSDPRISVLPSSNCYMVAPGDSVDIPVSRFFNGYEIIYGLSSSKPNLATLNFGASVIWQTAPNLVTIPKSVECVKKGFITVKVPSNSPEGNAVIGIGSSPSSFTFWSWHIWVTSYKPDKVTPNGPEGTIVMDRNLGATTNVLPNYTNWIAGQKRTDVGSFGLMYQWGRKDPFPGSAAITISSSSSTSGEATRMITYNASSNQAYPEISEPVAASLKESVIKPFVFYKGAENNEYDWYSNTSGKKDNTLWGVPKTIYDPCPNGWHVQNTDKWVAVSLFPTTSPGFVGRIFGTSLYMPSSGFYDYITGTLQEVGMTGYYWSCFFYSNNGGDFFRFNSDFYGIGGFFKAAGFPVRCVKE